jgi:hypothetical protein
VGFTTSSDDRCAARVEPPPHVVANVAGRKGERISDLLRRRPGLKLRRSIGTGIDDTDETALLMLVIVFLCGACACQSRSVGRARDVDCHGRGYSSSGYARLCHPCTQI